MSNQTKTPPDRPKSESRTRIIFDLRDELSAEELERFEAAAAQAGAADLTEHFLNLALRDERGAA